MDWGIFPERDEDPGDWKIADSAIAHLKQAPKRPAVLRRRRLPPAARAVLRVAEVVRSAPRGDLGDACRSRTTTATTCPHSRGSCTGSSPSRGCRG